jgi:hypothetical protein
MSTRRVVNKNVTGKGKRVRNRRNRQQRNRQVNNSAQTRKVLAPIWGPKSANKGVKIKQAANSVVISGKEIIFDLIGGGSKQWASKLCVTNNSVLPWLSTQAMCWEHWTPIELSFEYLPQVGMNADGGFVMYFDYDINDPIPTEYNTLYSNTRAVACPARQQATMHVDCTKWSLKRYFCSSSDAYPGILYGASSGVSVTSGTLLGRVICHYKVRFENQQVSSGGAGFVECWNNGTHGDWVEAYTPLIGSFWDHVHNVDAVHTWHTTALAVEGDKVYCACNGDYLVTIVIPSVYSGEYSKYFWDGVRPWTNCRYKIISANTPIGWTNPYAAIGDHFILCQTAAVRFEKGELFDFANMNENTMQQLYYAFALYVTPFPVTDLELDLWTDGWTLPKILSWDAWNVGKERPSKVAIQQRELPQVTELDDDDEPVKNDTRENNQKPDSIPTARKDDTPSFERSKSPRKK